MSPLSTPASTTGSTTASTTGELPTAAELAYRGGERSSYGTRDMATAALNATLAPGYVVTTLICAGLALSATGGRKGEDHYWLRL